MNNLLETLRKVSQHSFKEEGEDCVILYKSTLDAVIAELEEREESAKGCSVCGGAMVFIRGKYPKSPKRQICPTCACERLDRINDIIQQNYGMAYAEKLPLPQPPKNK